MTKLSLTLAVLLCSLNAVAQLTDPFAVNNILKHTANKTTGTDSRLIGDTYHRYDIYSGKLILIDSVYYSYIGNSARCETKTALILDNYGLNNSSRYTNTYDAQNRLVIQVSESWVFNLNKWEINGRNVYTYNNDGNVTTEDIQVLDGGNWDPRVKKSNTYNSEGKLIETVQQERPAGGQYVNNNKNVTSYNAIGMRETDTSYIWDTNSWKVIGITINFYSSNLLTKTAYYRLNPISSILEKNDSTIYVYDNKGKMIEIESEHFENNIWYRHKALLDYDAAGNWVTWTSQIFDNGSYVNLRQANTTYNNFNQMLSQTYKSWNTAKNQFEFGMYDFIDTYYYEQFENSIKDIIASGTIQVYPIPANNTLHLTLNWNKAQSAAVYLFDMTGKIAGHWALPVATNHTQTLDVSKIPAGGYVLKVNGTEGQLSKQINIVR